MHRSSCWVSREGHLLQELPNWFERALRGFVEERGDSVLVARKQQEAFAGLRKAAEFTAVMDGFCHGIPV